MNSASGGAGLNKMRRLKTAFDHRNVLPRICVSMSQENTSRTHSQRCAIRLLLLLLRISSVFALEQMARMETNNKLLCFPHFKI